MTRRDLAQSVFASVFRAPEDVRWREQRRSGWKINACNAGTEVQEAILKTDIERGWKRVLSIHVIEVSTGYGSGRVIAYREPHLRTVRLIEVVCRV